MEARVNRVGRSGRAANVAAFDPLSVPGLALDLVASPAYAFTDAGGTAAAGDGDAVRVWKDRSGNARDFSQATAANRPLLRLAADGTWGLAFDGADDFLAGAAILGGTGESGTAVLVVTAAAGTANKKGTLFSLGSGASEGGWAVGLGVGDFDTAGAGTELIVLFGGSRWIDMNVPAVVTGRAAFAARVSGSGTVTTTAAAPGGSASNSGADYLNPQAVTTVGCQRTTPTRVAPDGVVLNRVCYWTRALTDDELNRVRTRL